MHRLLHRLIDHFGFQAEQGADAGRLRRAEMGDVVYLMFMQADRAHQVDLDFITGGNAADQLGTRLVHGLRHGQDRRNVIAGVRVVGSQERVMHV